MAPKSRFALLWIIATLSALAAVVIINRIIDPYGLYAGPRWPGVNEIKPRPGWKLDDIKIAGALRRHADVLILGNSRSDIGLDPAHPLMRKVGAHPYNLSVPGRALETNVRQLEVLLAAGEHPRLMVVGVEFLDYLNGMPLASPPVPASMEVWRTRKLQLNIESMLTLTGLGASVETLWAQYAAYPATIRDDGFDPLLDYIGLARTDGYHAMFRQRGLDYAQRFKAAKWPRDMQATSSYIALERLLELSRTRNIRMELAIYPYHAQIVGLLSHYGFMPAFAEWKASLAETVSRAAAAGTPVRLWDFAVLDDRSAEAIPKAGDRKANMTWYWEAGHFKAPLGNLMLETMLSTEPSPSAIGQLLSPGGKPAPDLDQRLKSLLLARPDLARDLDEIIKSVH